MKYTIDIVLSIEQENALQSITERYNAVYEGQQDRDKTSVEILSTIANNSLPGALQAWDAILTAKQRHKTT